MSRRLPIYFAWIGALGMLLPAASAAQIPRSELLAAMQQANELSRYCYLLQAVSRVEPRDRVVAQQYLSFSESELGLYGEAVRDFPLKARLPDDLVLPAPREWEAVDAVDAIVERAADRRVVMVNEVHHDAHTRLLTLGLLPRLRKIGYTHLAIEALVEDDAPLRQRGYPTDTSGTEYLREPVYGEIVREALRLGYVIVRYDPDEPDTRTRESRQARTLYERVLAKDPHAKLLVHAGYAHIDKAPGRLGAIPPMAERLHELSGLDILSIDQSDVREEEPFNEVVAAKEVADAVRTDEALHGRPQSNLTPSFNAHVPLHQAYHRIVAMYEPKKPIVLRRAADGALWSARPRLYDMNVILPPANDRISSYVRDRVIALRNGRETVIALPPAADGHRPDWLSLGGRRVPLRVGADLCAKRFPCLVEAHYADEPDTAVAADRYVFLEAGGGNVLWLRPGSYRLRAVDARGEVLSEQSLPVHPASREAVEQL